MQNKELHLILGCFGLSEDEFVSCRACENTILIVDRHLHCYDDIMSYFDNCKLFDKCIFEFNAIKHFIHNVYNKFDYVTKPLWPERKYHLYQKFVIDHRLCGLYVRLDLIEKNEIIKSEVQEKSISIKAINNKKFPILKLKSNLKR